MSNVINSPVINLLARHKAFPYQTQAVMAVRDKDYCAIFHEQGLGKTKIAIDLMLYWLTRRDIDTVLVVTKKQLVENWKNEFAFHTHLKPSVLSTNRRDNYYVFNGVHRIVIANFETVSSEKERVALFLKCRSVAIVIDESTKLKNPNAKVTRDFFELSRLFKIRAIMTGTPVANRPYDIWSQIFFLDHGESLGADFELFKANTDLANDLCENPTSRRIFEEAVSGIYKKISSFTVRETKKTSGVVLPDKEFISIDASFEQRQRAMYRGVVRDLVLEVKKDGEKIFDDEAAVLKRLLRLNQIASNPKLVDDSYEAVSGKEVELDGLLADIKSAGEKCIVWSNYIENVDYFCHKYKDYNAVRIHGKLAIDQRNRAVKKFKEDPSCYVLFATPQSAKEGLTLTVANHVVFYDRGFNLDDYLQAQDRIHRISQKKKCFVYNLKIAGSIDDWIESLLEAKQRAAFLAQGDVSLKEYVKSADYSYGQIIREILGEEEAT